MILKLAWRNIWRNKRRTWILITAVAIGFFGLFFFLTLTEGAIRQVVKNVIDTGLGHIQIHKKGYLQDPEVKKYIKNPALIEEKLRSIPEIEIFTSRVNLQGVIYSAQEATAVHVLGGELEKEKEITKLDDYIIKGRFPENPGEILIGYRMAETLKVDLHDKVIVSCADVNGEIASYAFRISGIFKTPSMEVNRIMAVVDLKSASEIAGYKGGINEFVIRLKNEKNIEKLRSKIQSLIGEDYEVLTWGDVYPLLKYQIDMFAESMAIYGLIILLGAAFGIVNVFYMSIYERMREFGVVRALGMKPSQLRNLILAEGFLIALVAVGVGLAVSIAVHIYLSIKGLDLSVFSQSLELWGAGSIIYPYLNPVGVLQLIAMVFFVVLLSVFFPARKARKIIVSEALRYV